MEEKLRQQQSNIIKITVFGPESTGKTTLCQQLANHFNEPWIAEYAREYLQNKFKNQQKTCEPSDLLPIAVGQMALENNAISIAKKLLFCDTNLLLTKVYSELTYGFCDPILDAAAKKHEYDLFFLTDVDVPWQADNLREKPQNREEDFQYFKNTLLQNHKPYVTLSGTSEQRLQKAIHVILELQEAKKIGLNSYDFTQIYNRNIPMSKIQQQLFHFVNGIQKINLAKAAAANDGIFLPKEFEIQNYVNVFEEYKNNFVLQKFVPASGAASRMFKFLSEFLNDYKYGFESINAYINRKKATELSIFLLGLSKFPFYSDIVKTLKINPQFDTWTKDDRDFHFIKTMLSDLQYANKPKGILPFHVVDSKVVSAITTHLHEAISYAKANNIAKLHFTISKEHESDFNAIIAKEKEANDSFQLVEITFSYQQQFTDTIAVNMQNLPLRDKTNQLVFRPGGHGALIENLNNLEADIIFIKNIDNVSHQNIEETILYKKLLAGILIDTQKQIFEYLNHFHDYDISEIENFASSKCNIFLGKVYHSLTPEQKTYFMKAYLSRPIRVCGMVKNEGEPGGGPFWIGDESVNMSLQIVESVQIDLKNKDQIAILNSATHFNPVDLVCGIKNHKNEKFDLLDYIDENAGFIVEKNKSGVDLKGFELPGLWNGAMAHWITIFVEVPLATFSPVKTVNDLLKSAHQNHE